MSDQLSMFDLMISETTHNAIFSQASASGPTPCAAPDGPTTDLSGQAAARASLSPRQAKEKGLLTSGTYGRTGTISSSSAALRTSLESRLQARTALIGSTLFKLTWKERVTPAGRSICALRASALRTSGNGCSSWPTPTVADAKRGAKDTRPWNTGRPLGQIAALAGWATPTTRAFAGYRGLLRDAAISTDGAGEGNLETAWLLDFLGFWRDFGEGRLISSTYPPLFRQSFRGRDLTGSKIGISTFECPDAGSYTLLLAPGGILPQRLPWRRGGLTDCNRLQRQAGGYSSNAIDPSQYLPSETATIEIGSVIVPYIAVSCSTSVSSVVVPATR